MAGKTNENIMLSVISRPMQIWLAVILLSYLLVQFVFPQMLGPLYMANGQVFAEERWFNVLGVAFFAIAFLLSNVQPKNLQLETFRVFVIILLSVILLAGAVFLTGGFTDSPFAGAIALYIGFFIILTRRQAYRKANAGLILITVFLLAAPYMQLSRQGYAELHILHWNDHPGVLWSRWIISIVILLIAGLVGDQISDRVSETVK